MVLTHIELLCQLGECAFGTVGSAFLDLAWIVGRQVFETKCGYFPPDPDEPFE